MWEPTGKKATDRTTGAKLTEMQMTETGSLRWDVRKDDVLIGYVHSYEGYVDKSAPGSRIVYSRTVKTMWACVKVRIPGGPRPRTAHRHATRARAVFWLLNY
jgi:hypothetical protein